MRKSNLKIMYEVIGPDDSIYLSRTNAYLKHGQQLELTPEEAETLLGNGLVKEVKGLHQEKIEETQE